MTIREGTDNTLIAAINAAPRAMVILSVPWSCPERIAQDDFRKAVSRLTEIGIHVEAFAMDEESEACQLWLSTLGLPALTMVVVFLKGGEQSCGLSSGNWYLGLPKVSTNVPWA